MSYTIITQPGQELGKTFTATSTAKSRTPYHGATYIVSTEPIATILPTLKGNQVICLGIPNNSTKGLLTTKKQAAQYPNHIARTNENFHIDSKALVVIDVDTGAPADEVLRFLRDIGITADVVEKPGSSRDITLEDGSAHPRSKDNSAHFIIEFHSIPSTSDYTALMKVLHKIAISKGLGSVKVQANGTIRINSIVDDTVSSSNGILYARTNLTEGTKQKWELHVHKGKVPTQRYFMPQLDQFEYSSAVEQLRESVAEESQDIKELIAAQKEVEGSKIGGIQHIDAAANNIVFAESTTMMEVQGHGKLSLLEIVINAHKYDGVYCQNPMFEFDSATNNETKARIHLDADRLLGLYSFKMGREQLEVRLHIDTALAIAGTKHASDSHNVMAGVNDEKLIHMCVVSKMDEDELHLVMNKMKSGDRKSKKEALKTYKNIAKKKIRLSRSSTDEDTELLDFRTDTVPEGSVPDVKISIAGEITHLNTSQNLEYILMRYGLSLYLETQSGDYFVDGLGIRFNGENALNTMLARVGDVMRKNDIRIKDSEVISSLMNIVTDNQLLKKNEILDLILGTAWDKRDRLAEYLGSITIRDNTQQTLECFKRAVTKTLIGGVAALDRLENCPRGDAEPKYELMPILCGEQGMRKSSIIKMLIPKEVKHHYGTISKFDPHNKDDLMVVGPKWAVEFGEIDSTFTNAAKVSALKEYRSKEIVEYRKPYAVSPVKAPVKGWGMGTVNGTLPLKDRTGNRRWPTFEVIQVDIPEWDEQDKQQLWAQIWELYVAGEAWWFTAEEEALQELENAFFISENYLNIEIENAVAEFRSAEPFSASDLAKIIYGIERLDQGKVTTIGKTLSTMGFIKSKKNGSTFYTKRNRNV